jgi:hypothetical protein
MTKAPSPLRKAVAPLVTLVVLLVVFAPVLLFGRSLGSLDLVFVAMGLLAGGIVLSRVGGGNMRTVGKLLAVVGVVLLIAAVVVLVLALGGMGRPF